MSNDIIITGLTEVVRALEGAAPILNTECRTAVQVNSNKVKKAAQAKITGHPYLPAYPYSITYDTKVTPEGAEGEIGPDKGRPQGPLGNIIEYGTSKNAPIPHLAPALEENADDLYVGVSMAVTKALNL